MPRKLHAGKGAICSVLTRYISPKQCNAAKDHRSEIVLVDRYRDDKGKQRYSFRLKDEHNGDFLLNASCRFVKVVREGELEDIFDEEGVGESNRSRWANSKARRLLYKDVLEGVISSEIQDGEDLESIYGTRKEYAAYDFAKFGNRLAGIAKDHH